MFYYFVSFAHDHGFGNSQVSVDGPITTLGDILKITQDIQKNLPYVSNIVILNYQLLRKEAVTE